MKTFVTLVAGMILGALIGCTTMMAQPAPVPQEVVLSVPDDSGRHEPLQIPIPDAMPADANELLQTAYSIAEADGLPHPQLLQAILLQESAAGTLGRYKVAGQEYGLRPLQRYYGVAQIKLDATRDVLKRFPALWNQFHFQTKTDEEIVAKLIENDVFNVTIASKYLVLLQASGYHSPMALAVAYNKGPGGARGVDTGTDPYSRGVTKHMHKLGGAVVATSYHVLPGDSLSKIAMDLKISMTELFAANPTAFIGGDPNVLLAGVDLRIPGAHQNV